MTVRVTTKLLRAMPLPVVGTDADKGQRGRVLIMGGSARVPGAPLRNRGLTGGAGKLQIACPRSLTNGVGLACPEAGVVPLDETRQGDPRPGVNRGLLEALAQSDAALVGPGIQGERTPPIETSRAARGLRRPGARRQCAAWRIGDSKDVQTTERSRSTDAPCRRNVSVCLRPHGQGAKNGQMMCHHR
jgi:hypothetical protein